MDAAFTALADPTRRRVLETLRGGERSAGDIERTLARRNRLSRST